MKHARITLNADDCDLVAKVLQLFADGADESDAGDDCERLAPRFMDAAQKARKAKRWAVCHACSPLTPDEWETVWTMLDNAADCATDDEDAANYERIARKLRRRDA